MLRPARSSHTQATRRVPAAGRASASRALAASVAMHAVVLGAAGLLAAPALLGGAAGPRARLAFEDGGPAAGAPDRSSLAERAALPAVRHEPLDVVDATTWVERVAVSWAAGPEPELERSWPASTWTADLAPSRVVPLVREAEPEPVASPAPPAQALAPEPAPEPVRVAPRLVHSPPPDYPDLARRRGWQGTVRCRLTVGPEGEVVDVRVARSSGHAVLDDAATTAVRAWRFRPGRVDDVATRADVLHDVVFRLAD